MQVEHGVQGGFLGGSAQVAGAREIIEIDHGLRPRRPGSQRKRNGYYESCQASAHICLQ